MPINRFISIQFLCIHMSKTCLKLNPFVRKCILSWNKLVYSLTPEFCSFCSLFFLFFSFVHSLVLLFFAGSFWPLFVLKELKPLNVGFMPHTAHGLCPQDVSGIKPPFSSFNSYTNACKERVTNYRTICNVMLKLLTQNWDCNRLSFW